MDNRKNGGEKREVWLIFHKEKLLLAENPDGVFTLPAWDSIAPLAPDLSGKKDLKLSGPDTYWLVSIPQEPVLPDGMRFVSLSRLFADGHKQLYKIAGRAVQILAWDRTHRYCGQCGSKTEERSNEFAKVCPECGFTSYPRISPSIIVAVIKGKELFLARSTHFQKYNFHTLISGFVEPGESLEECLRREVKEEAGITVKNIRYFGSQPWPFPNSLMLAFTAEHDCGEIVLDDEELYEAGWFAVDRLPPLPDSDSIARRLIDWFIENY